MLRLAVLRARVGGQRAITLGQLALAQAVSSCCALLGMIFAPLAALALTEQPTLATVPMTVSLLASAAAASTLAPWLRRKGYSRILLVGAIFGVTGGLFCALALYVSSFAVLIFGAGLLGCQNALAGFQRFAALDVARADQRGQALTALFGTAAAAVILISLAIRYLSGLPIHRLQSGYILLTLLALVAVPTLAAFIEPMAPRESPANDPGRSLAASLSRGEAIFTAAIGQIFMAIGMVLMPVAASEATHHALAAVTKMAQWHMLGMLAPAAVAGPIVDRYGSRIVARVTLAGLALTGLLTLITSHPSTAYGAAFVFGAGANILLVAASCGLTSSCTGQERARWQPLMEAANAAAMVLTALIGSLMLALFTERLQDLVLALCLFGVLLVAIHSPRRTVN